MKLKILIISLFIGITVNSNAQVKKIAGEFVETTLTIVGRNSLSSSKVIKEVFTSDFSEYIYKNFDDDIIERLAKSVSENPKLKSYLTKSKTAIKVWSLMGSTNASTNVKLVKYFTEIMDNIGEQKFKNKYVFENIDDILLLKDKKGRLIAEIDNNIIRAKSWKGGLKNELNPLLNERKLIPNSKIIVNGQKYSTDALNRVSEISGNLSRKDLKKVALRNGNNQTVSKQIKNGLANDDAGHIIARMFGGGSELYNYFPMSRKLNRQGGLWAKMEQKWAKALREGKKVDYKITPFYNGGSKRPDKLIVTYTIEGKRITEIFDNTIH